MKSGGRPAPGISHYVSERLAVIAERSEEGVGWLVRPNHPRPDHQRQTSLREYLVRQTGTVRRSFERFRVIDLLEEVRASYWGNAVIELSQPPMPGISLRRDILTIGYRPVARQDLLYRMVSAQVTRTMIVQGVEPAFRLLRPLMIPNERAAVDVAIESQDPTEEVYRDLLYATERALGRLEREGPSNATQTSELLTPRAPQQEVENPLGCDLLYSYHDECVSLDEGPGPDNPYYLTKPKHTRILAGSPMGTLRDVIGKQVVAELIGHDLRFTGLAGADIT